MAVITTIDSVSSSLLKRLTFAVIISLSLVFSGIVEAQVVVAPGANSFTAPGSCSPQPMTIQYIVTCPGDVPAGIFNGPPMVSAHAGGGAPSWEWMAFIQSISSWLSPCEVQVLPKPASINVCMGPGPSPGPAPKPSGSSDGVEQSVDEAEQELYIFGGVEEPNCQPIQGITVTVSSPYQDSSFAGLCGSTTTVYHSDPKCGDQTNPEAEPSCSNLLEKCTILGVNSTVVYLGEYNTPELISGLYSLTNVPGDLGQRLDSERHSMPHDLFSDAEVEVGIIIKTPQCDCMLDL